MKPCDTKDMIKQPQICKRRTSKRVKVEPNGEVSKIMYFYRFSWVDLNYML